jgi:hypothetical protein
VQRIDPDAWLAGNPSDRSVQIIVAGDRIRQAMELPEVRIIPTAMKGDGIHRVDEEGHRIEINSSLDISSTLSTLTHEMRHAYQLEAVAGREIHPESSSWAENTLDYMHYDDNYEEYATQPLEADAFGFERAVGRLLGLDWPNL